MTLHLTYRTDASVRDRLDQWENGVRAYPDLGEGNWRFAAVWPAARDASVSGSTGIEGNPLVAEQVGSVLAGVAVDANREHVREVVNYNRALIVARDAIERSDFEWTHQIVHDINRTVMDGLDGDTHGDYRGPSDDVHIGIYTGPGGALVPDLMLELVEWLRRSSSMSTVIRSALVHLNLIAIHPFSDGNGRTARILAAMALMGGGIRAPELISIEAYIRRNDDEYRAALRATLGTSYDPDNHPVADWLDYYTRISLDRVSARNRMLDAVPADMGVLYAALADRAEPIEWAPALLAARVSRLRTADLAVVSNRSMPAARAELARIAAAGWIHPRGATRGRWYAPSDDLAALPLRVPTFMGLMARGDVIGTVEPVPATRPGFDQG
jgi:Fic/DOC family